MIDSQETGAPSLSVELRHTEGYDVILNARHPDQEKIRAVADMVQDGIPKSWVKLKYIDGDGDPGPSRSFKDARKNPKFFAKIRINTSEEQVKEALAGKGQSTPRVVQAFNSLVNEFAISNDVKQALKDPEVAEIISRYGFEEISFIEPLVGLTEKKTKKKIMVYDFVVADEVDVEKMNQEGPINKMNQLYSTNTPDNKWTFADQLAFELGQVFFKHGIVPHDLGSHQLMSSKDDGSGKFKLYLMDIEGFYKKPPNWDKIT